jgi:hypothetical protein
MQFDSIKLMMITLGLESLSYVTTSTIYSILIIYCTLTVLLLLYIYIPGIRDKTIRYLKLCVTRNCHVRPVFSPKYIWNTQKHAYVTKKLSVSPIIKSNR